MYVNGGLFSATAVNHSNNETILIRMHVVLNKQCFQHVLYYIALYFITVYTQVLKAFRTPGPTACLKMLSRHMIVCRTAKYSQYSCNRQVCIIQEAR